MPGYEVTRVNFKVMGLTQPGFKDAGSESLDSPISQDGRRALYSFSQLVSEWFDTVYVQNWGSNPHTCHTGSACAILVWSPLAACLPGTRVSHAQRREGTWWGIEELTTQTNWVAEAENMRLHRILGKLFPPPLPLTTKWRKITLLISVKTLWSFRILLILFCVVVLVD